MPLKSEHRPDPFGPDFDRQPLGKPTVTHTKEWELGPAVSVRVEVGKGGVKMLTHAGGGTVLGEIEDFRQYAAALLEACDVADEMVRLHAGEGGT